MKYLFVYSSRGDAKLLAESASRQQINRDAASHTFAFSQRRVVVNSAGVLGFHSSIFYEGKDLRAYVRLDLLFGTKVLDERKGFRIIGGTA